MTYNKHKRQQNNLKLTLWQRISGKLPDPPSPPPFGSYNGYTLDRWRQSQPHIDFARDLLAMPKFRDMLAVLANARPVTSNTTADATGAARLLGVREGYDILLSVLLSLGDAPKAEPAEVPADYGASEFSIDRTM